VGKRNLTIGEARSFTEELFDRPDLAEKAARIIKAIYEARSPRVSDIACAMEGDMQANYKMIERFLKVTDTKAALNRLYFEPAPFIIGDPTEIERLYARKTAYVGKLKDGKKRGFNLFPLGFPYHSRVIPFHSITYSSKTISAKANNSRNWEHRRALRRVKELIGDVPVVLDREFSYESLLEDCLYEEVKFVIRLNLASGVNFTDQDGDPVALTISTGQTAIHRGVYYKGNRKIKVNLIGYWEGGFKEPLWVITNLDRPEEALEIYKSRMKIEESFKDLKSLLQLDKIMNKSQEYLEKMIDMVMLAFAIGLLIGESIRETSYKGKKAENYSGLFIFLKHLRQIPLATIVSAIASALVLFKSIVLGVV
jgi:Transposase DDE domain